MTRHEAIYSKDGYVSLGLHDTARLGNGELLADPLFVGICGTDIQIIRRQRPDPAAIVGHEGVAQIIDGSSLGAGVKVGDRIIFNPVDPTNQRQILGHNTPGLLQRRYILTRHALEHNQAVPFPDDVDPKLGALVEPLGTVLYGHSLVSKAVRQSCIAIVGAGAIGIMHALYAKALGYKRVILVNASKPHLEWCIERGIVNKSDTFLDSDSLAGEITSATDGKGVDAAYMCTSRPNALTALSRAVGYVRQGGCINLFGGIQDGDQIAELPSISDLNAIRRSNSCGIPKNGVVVETVSSLGKKLYLTGNRGTSSDQLTDVIRMLREHGDTFQKVISHVVSFEAAVDLLQQIADGPIREYKGSLYIKAVIDMHLAGEVVQTC